MNEGKESVRIVGLGSSIGSRRISNESLEGRLGLSSIEIEKKTGVRYRFHCDTTKENLYVLMASAACQALNSAQISIREIDGVFCACNPTGDFLLPNTGSIVASLLDLPRFYSGGNSTGCSGGLIALDMAFNKLSQNSKMGIRKNYLVLAGDQTSSMIKLGSSDEILFSDGASAVVISNDASAGYYGIELLDNQTFHDGADALKLKRNSPFLEHDGRAIYELATRSMNPVLDMLGIEEFPKDVYLIPHQANLRIIDKFAKKISADSVYRDGIVNIGNASLASVFIGLEDVNRRALSPHSKIVLAAFGEGFTVAVAKLKSAGKTLPARLDDEELKTKYMERYKSKWQ